MKYHETPFEIHYDRKARLLSWAMRDFWTMADVGNFIASMRDTVGRLGPPPFRFDNLCDASGFPVQSTEVANALGEFDRFAASMREGRLAIVVASTINKLQVQRTLTADGVRTFSSVEEARAWLHQEPDTTS